MKMEKILVTTSVNGRSRKIVWDPSEPMEIDQPKSWVLKTDRRGSVHVATKKAKFDISNDLIDSGSSVILPTPENENRKITLQLQRVPAIRAAYLPSLAHPHDQYHPGVSQFFASFGVRKYLLDYQPFSDAFVGYVRRKPVFTFVRSAEGNRIKPLLSDMRLKFKGEAPHVLKMGETVNVSDADLEHTMILWGTHWWRINMVDVPAALPVDEDKKKGIVGYLEDKWFKNAIKGIAVAFFLFSGALLVIPKPEVKKEEIIPPPDLGKVQIKQAKFTPRVIRGEQSEPEGVASVPTEENKPIPSPPKAHNKPTNAQTTPTLTKNPPVVQKPAVEKSEDRKAKEAAARQANAAKAAAARTKMLKDSVLGALKSNAILSKNAAQGTKGSNEGDDLFHGNGTEMNPTEVRPGYAVKSTGVETIGGGGTNAKGNGSSAVSYGSGDRGTRTGKGGGLVSVDPSGPTVETGLTRDEVGQVIHSHMSEIRYCYESATLRKPGLEGKVVLGFTINGGGKVKGASVENSTVNDRILEQCVLTRLVNWKFPKTRGGIDVGVSYPFMFKLLGKN